MKTHSILQYIRRSQYRRIIFPVVLLAITIFLMLQLPLLDYLQIREVSSTERLTALQAKDSPYVTCFPGTLYYTGDDYWRDGQLTGHYYYELTDTYCRFYIISAKTGQPAAKTLEGIYVTGNIRKPTEDFNLLLTNLAKRIYWTETGIRTISDAYIIDETAYLPMRQLVLLVCLGCAAVIALLALFRMITYLIFPRLSPAYLHLGRYGNPRKLIRFVEYELENSVIIHTKDMVLTSHYLVEFSEDVTALIPLESVLWTYEYATLRYRFPFKHVLRHNLHIVTVQGDHYLFKNKQAEDVERIYEELTNRFPNFFFGYSQEHEEMVRHILKDNKK